MEERDLDGVSRNGLDFIAKFLALIQDKSTLQIIEALMLRYKLMELDKSQLIEMEFPGWSKVEVRARCCGMLRS